MGPLSVGLIPARLVLRALDDLHTVAVAAQDLGPRLGGLEARFDRIEDEIEEAIGVARQIEQRGTAVLSVAERALALGERIDDRAEGLLALGERVDERADAVLALGERIEQRAGAIVELGDSAEELVQAILAEGKLIEAAAQEVANTGAELAAALPILQKAMEMTAPLEGAVERIGRVVDRLPGGKVAPRGRLSGPRSVPKP